MGAAGDEKAAAAAGAGAAEGEGAVDSKDLQQQSKVLDKLTDHVEDRQLDSSRVQSVHFIRSLSHNIIIMMAHMYLSSS
jgi:hypothetical protein